MVEDPLIAEGAGLAARTAERLLIGVPRSDDPRAETPVCPEEYRLLRKVGMGNPDQFAKPRERLSYAFFSYVENGIAAAGPVVDGRGELYLDPANLLSLRVRPVDGSPPIELPVNGVPVVAHRAPLQIRNAPWSPKHELGFVDVLPFPVMRLVRDALMRQLKLTAAPVFDDGFYCGYSLFVDAPITVRDAAAATTVSATVRHRVDVTAAAGFLFPYEWLPPGEDRAALAGRISSTLESHEPLDLITDFEARYLASATIARWYSVWRERERKGAK